MSNAKDNLVEATKKLLYEQANSAMNSYDSAPDSLDKAYLTIMFGNIAFYATKIKPYVNCIYLDLASMDYMALALMLILFSFMLSKSNMRLLYENTLIQIDILESEDSVNLTNEEIKQTRQNLSRIDKLNRWIEQLNWQIPLMVFCSSSLCFIKVGFQESQLFLMK